MPIVRTVLWAVVLLVGLALPGRAMIRAFRPPPDVFGDFLQEWLSAKNYFAGMPIYETQIEALAKHRPDLRFDRNGLLPYNAHPPVAIVLVLPLAHLEYRDAHWVWNLVTFPLFLLVTVLIFYELVRPLRWWHLIPLGAVLVWFEPIVATLVYGQLSFPLVTLFGIGWIADRRGYQLPAGVAVGLATGLKLFPGFLLIYFVFARRWRALAAAIVTCLAVNALALLLLGFTAFETYVTTVIPSLKNYQYSWLNVSLNGFWIRLFDPHPIQSAPQPYHSALLAKLLFVTSGLGIAAVLAWFSWQGSRTKNLDRPWALAVMGMVLVSPIAWPHYAVLLVIPVTLLLTRLPSIPLRVLAWVCVIGLCVSDLLYLKLFVSPAHSSVPNPAFRHLELTVAENLLGPSFKTYLLFILFVLTLTLPKRSAASSPSENVTTASTVTEPPASSGTPPPSPALGL